MGFVLHFKVLASLSYIGQLYWPSVQYFFTQNEYLMRLWKKASSLQIINLGYKSWQSLAK
jgi:hypothetical protein